MDSIPRRWTLLAACVAVAAGPGAFAAGLTVLPQPGLWENQMTMTVNGHDPLAEAKAAQESKLAQLDPQRRAMVEQMMKSHDMSHSMQCITPEKAAKAADPNQMLASMSTSKTCTFAPATIAGNEIHYSGTCTTAAGPIKTNGVVTIQDSRNISSRMIGEGVASAATASYMHVPAGAPYTSVMQATMHWVSAQCGNVAPAGDGK